jgi:hypothetical protein
MPSSLFDCVKSADVAAVGKTADGYKKMSRAVVPAACTAGGLLKDRMQKLIRGEQSISMFHDVADHITIFEDSSNLVVGVPPGPMLAKAQQMDSHYQVADVAGDLAKQSGDVENKFYEELSKAAGS